MHRVILVAQVLLGLPLVVFGLNGFLHFLPQPEGFPPAAMSFLKALDESVYLLPLKSGIEVACGLMLLSGRLVPLALILFAPILVNIVAFHYVLDDPKNGAVGYAMLVLELLLAWAYGPAFRGVLSLGAKTRFSPR